MAQRSRTSKTLLSCGLGCGGAVVLLLGSCFAFQAWLKRPGELLAPTAMLDARASAHVALRLDLADTPTRELVDQLLAAARRPAERLRGHRKSPLMDFFVSWNENRKRQDLTRLFPMTAAWVTWPGEHGAESVGAIVVSARGMGHQVIFMDWVLGILSGRVEGMPARIVAGERVYEIPTHDDETIYAFLDPAGVVVCLDLASVAPAAERLRQLRVDAGAPHRPSELERRLTGVPANLPLRGAVLDHDGEIAQLLAWLAADAERGEGDPSWEPIDAATVGGRFTGGTSIALTLELAVDPATSAARREVLLADLQRYFREHWSEREATVRPSSQGVTLELLVDDVPRRLEELQRRHGRQPAATPEPGADSPQAEPAVTPAEPALTPAGASPGQPR